MRVRPDIATLVAGCVIPTAAPSLWHRCTAVGAEALGIGREATPEEIAGWDIDIRPDGQGLPLGKGTVKQGEAIYMQQCAACHGEFGESAGRWPILSGGDGTLRRRSGEVDRLVLALCLDGDGLHPPRHAVRQRAVAHQ